MKKVKTLLNIRKAKQLVKYHLGHKAIQRGSYLIVPDELYLDVTKLLRNKERSLLSGVLIDANEEGYLDGLMGWK